MRDMEILFKLVVPAVLLLLWVLGQVANREAKAPPRVGPPLPPPGGPPQRRPTPTLWPPEPVPPRRGAGLTSSGAQSGDILFLEPRSGGERTATSRPRRGPGRKAPAPPLAAPKASAEPKRLLSRTPLADAIEAEQAVVASAAAPKASSLPALRKALLDPEQTRQAILLAEILRPPLALRGDRRLV